MLNAQPTADVTIDLSSSDASEGTLDRTKLTFTPTNWRVPQTVTVTGVDDLVDDGDRPYMILTQPASSLDPLYNGMIVPDVSLINLDDDTAGFVVTPTTGLLTTEAGGTAQFTVVLRSQPTANVTVGLSSSDLTEGSPSPASLTFTAANWNQPRVVTVTGLHDENLDGVVNLLDFEWDGDVNYSIITQPAISSDPKYSGLNPPKVSVTNLQADHYWALDFGTFDFDTGGSPVQTGFVQASPQHIFGQTSHGWVAQSGTVLARDRGEPFLQHIFPDVIRDFNFTQDAVFQAPVPNGRYRAVAAFYDPLSLHDQMGLYFEGTLVDTVTAAKGQLVENLYENIVVNDGVLTLRLRDLGGSDGNAIINGLLIVPADPIELELTEQSQTVSGLSLDSGGKSPGETELAYISTLDTSDDGDTNPLQPVNLWITGVVENVEVYGRGGNDRIDAGSGDDVVTGDSGVSVKITLVLPEIVGGAGVAGTAEIAELVDIADVGEAIDELPSGGSSSFFFQPLSVSIVGIGGGAILDGEAGNDTIGGGTGDDQIVGGNSVRSEIKLGHPTGLEEASSGTGGHSSAGSSAIDVIQPVDNDNGTPTDGEQLSIVGIAGDVTLGGGAARDSISGQEDHDHLTGDHAVHVIVEAGVSVPLLLDDPCADSVTAIVLSGHVQGGAHASGAPSHAIANSSNFASPAQLDQVDSLEPPKVIGVQGNVYLTGAAGDDDTADGGAALDAGSGAATIFGDNSIVSTVTSEHFAFDIVLTGIEGDASLTGTAGNDVLSGSQDPLRMVGDHGIQVSVSLTGGAGNQKLNGIRGMARLIAGAGSDLLTAAVEPGELTGDNAVLIDASLTDSANGALVEGISNVFVGASAAADTVLASPRGQVVGDNAVRASRVLAGLNAQALTTVSGLIDVVAAAADDELHGGFLQVGDNAVFAGEPEAEIQLVAQAGNDTIVKGDSSELAFGDNWIFGLQSADQVSLHAALGSDRVQGGAGLDRIHGDNGIFGLPEFGYATGNVQITGGVGDDTLTGGGFIDVIFGQEGDDHVDGGDASDLLHGGSGDDTILGGPGDDQIQGGVDQDRLEGGTGSDTITGGAGDDVYIFAGTNLGRDELVEDPDADVDLLDFSGLSVAVAIDLSVTSDQIANQHLSVALSSTTGFENVIGTAESDHITGNSRDNELSGLTGDDTYVFRDDFGAVTIVESAGNGYDTMDFAAVTRNLTFSIGTILVTDAWGNLARHDDDRVEQLIGGSGQDTFRFGDAARLAGGAGFVDGGPGRDWLDYSLYTSDIIVDLQSGTAPGVPDFVRIENVRGGLGDDRLQGDAAFNRLHGGPGHDLLEGRGGTDLLHGDAGNDTYVFVGADLGADFVIEALDDAVDTLDFSNLVGHVNIALDTVSQQTVNAGNLELRLLSPSGIENVIGSAFADTIAGNRRDNLLAGGGGDDTYRFADGFGNDLIVEASDAGDDTLLFHDVSVDLIAHLGELSVTDGTNTAMHAGGAIELIEGGTGDDAFVFAADAGLADGVDRVDGHGGVNTLVYSSATAPVVVNLRRREATGVARAQHFHNVFGGHAADVLRGDRDDNLLIGNGGDDLLDGYGGDDRLEGGIGNDTLEGGAGNDELLGGEGDDLLEGGRNNDIYLFADDWGEDLLDDVGGSDSTDFGSVTAALVFDIASGTITDGIHVVTDTSRSVESLLGGLSDDVFVFEDGVTLAGSDGLMNGGGGANVLDYSAYTSTVIVNLATGSATGTAGIMNIQHVRGGSGNDTITGDAGNNILRGGAGEDRVLGGPGDDILLGGDGRDLLFGGAGRDLLLGGWGRDVFLGGTDDDLLIGDHTIYDQDDEALMALLAIWTSEDDYRTRVEILMDESSAYHLRRNETVFDDLDEDWLIGQQGLDWFFAALGDTVLDLQPAENLR